MKPSNILNLKDKISLPKGTNRLLIIDDDQNIRDVLEEFLSEKGYEVETSGEGNDALEKIKTTRFDVIVLDLKLPGMDGIDVLKAIVRIDPDTMVIMMTGYASLETAIESIREGAYDYITKPFRLEEIHIAIRNAYEKLYLRRHNKQIVEELRRVNEYSEKRGFVDKSLDVGKGREKDVIDEFVRLTELKERGIITNEEFLVLKKHYM